MPCCLDKAPRNLDDSGPDRSRADYVWCTLNMLAGIVRLDKGEDRARRPVFAVRKIDLLGLR
jgi:hypothetical protein